MGGGPGRSALPGRRCSRHGRSRRFGVGSSRSECEVLVKQVHSYVYIHNKYMYVVYIYTQIHIHACIYMYVGVCIYIYIYICVYIYIWKERGREADVVVCYIVCFLCCYPCPYLYLQISLAISLSRICFRIPMKVPITSTCPPKNTRYNPARPRAQSYNFYPMLPSSLPKGAWTP